MPRDAACRGFWAGGSLAGRGGRAGYGAMPGIGTDAVPAAICGGTGPRANRADADWRSQIVRSSRGGQIQNSDLMNTVKQADKLRTEQQRHVSCAGNGRN